MARYYVDMDIQPNGEHEVHRSGCRRLPGIQHRVFLGDFISCHAAVTQARNYYPHVRGCPACCNACHTE